MTTTPTAPANVSVLATDGYKFSMAEAGWPLRTETFHYAHRRGGRQVVPFDLEPILRRHLPSPAARDRAYLAEHQYDPGAGTWAALAQHEALTVRALPKGAYFYPREPVFSVSGPSALVSWLEPLLLQLNFRIQVATIALLDREALEAALGVVTCEAQRDLALETLDAVGVPAVDIRVDPGAYHERVRRQVAALREAVGDPARLFEVGLRAATCLEQHLIALDACKQEGITRTSNVLGAQQLGMVPVGTMGHEHVQRYGSDDAAFRAMRERRPSRSSYLLDTFDTLGSGLPAAYRLIAQAPERGDSIRYDSGDKQAQYKVAIAEARRLGLHPVQILEDALDLEATRAFEALRRQVGWPAEAQFYGYGGFLVARPAPGPFTRDRVAAVYKLSQSGDAPTMKFGDESGGGKQSVPGRPVVWRRLGAGEREGKGEGPVGIIGQEGEPVPDGYRLLTGAEADVGSGVPGTGTGVVAYSPETRALIRTLRRRREEAMSP